MKKGKLYTSNRTYWINEQLNISADSDLININLEEIFKVEIHKLELDISSSSEAEISEKEARWIEQGEKLTKYCLNLKS